MVSRSRWGARTDCLLEGNDIQRACYCLLIARLRTWSAGTSWFDAFQVTPRVQGHQEPLTAPIDEELVVLRKELIEGFHGAGTKLRISGVPIHVGVFDDQIIAGLN